MYIIHQTHKNCHLLHVCCAPDLVISYLSGARGDVFFYNPNIHPKDEYEKRYIEVLKVAKLFNMNVLDASYEPEIFFKETRGFENDPELGKRCEICVKIRLQKSFEVAKKFDYKSLSTSLTASPKKSVEIINKIGLELGKSSGVVYLPNVYRKSFLYNDAQRLIKQLGIYRQNYCGCVYSLKFSRDNLNFSNSKTTEVL
ncbi:MAG: epoxyqueuosine reductase QueH [Fervidobacterium sp.]|nr:epoxyqueuosine reductase QueH [Fervidobacterium sp.]